MSEMDDQVAPEVSSKTGTTLDADRAHLGLVRRMRAIATADDDAGVADDVLKAARAAVDDLPLDDLESYAGTHFLFTDDAPMELMVDFWLRKRLAKERLRRLLAG